jgi:hypothetical protein
MTVRVPAPCSVTWNAWEVAGGTLANLIPDSGTNVPAHQARRGRGAPRRGSLERAVARSSTSRVRGFPARACPSTTPAGRPCRERRSHDEPRGVASPVCARRVLNGDPPCGADLLAVKTVGRCSSAERRVGGLRP